MPKTTDMMDTRRILINALHYLSITTELENFDKIHEEIKKGIIFKGTNLWILIFAIVVASVGLNMNSTAVIIGAMLISPLMGPINGIGYSIATYDFALLRESLRNFGYAVGISLIASTGYFLLSPISSAHSELLARTYPTIYDVLIALFGGLAGIVAISSRNKGNVIPGVAIATALMPPLCTAGYGLATLQLNFFYGAFYLFTINSVFIAIASMVISRLLKFPIYNIVDSSKKKRINQIIYLIIFLVFIPSVYFGYKLIQKERFIENANKYISNVSAFEGNYLLKSKIVPGDNQIILTYGGKNLTDAQKESIIQKATNFNLKEPKVVIEQGLIFEEAGNTDKELVRLRNELYQATDIIKEKQFKLDSISNIPYTGSALLNELRKFYPQIIGCTYAQTLQFNVTGEKPEKIRVIIFTTDKRVKTAPDKEKIIEWVKIRVNSKNIKVVFE